MQIGIIQKLKGLFSQVAQGKEEPEEEIEMTLEELLEKIRNARKKWQEEQAGLLRVQFEEMRKTANKVMEALEELENAKLRNPNLTMKEKQFMKGNREHYVHLTRNFLEKIMEEIRAFQKTGGSTHEAEKFRQNFDSRRGTLSKATQRNFMVLQDFFKNEVTHVARMLSHLEKQAASLSGIIRNREEAKREKLEHEIERVARIIKALEENKSELKKLKQKERKLQKELAAQNEELELYKKEKEYLEFEALKDKLSKKRKEISALKNSIKNRIAQMDKPLRKYQHIAMDGKDIGEMVKEPFMFIVNNPEKSSEIISKLVRAIETGQVDIKDKQKDKVIKAAKELLKEEPSQVSGRAKQLIDEEEKLMQAEEKHPARKKIEDLGEKISGKKEEIQRVQTRIALLEDEVSKDMISEEIKKIEEEANKVLSSRERIIIRE
ncbi:hypothetical protein D6764_02170 [Candidatus Woesearchaeota archaeon]|nr:MAG: hypothetical protein D6764_02170 [Candidatus Woesearchaeota archaeon]